MNRPGQSGDGMAALAHRNRVAAPAGTHPSGSG